MQKINVGARGSKLSLINANIAINLMQISSPHMQYIMNIITTTGDKILDKPLYEIGGKQLFVKEIEQELLDKKIDIAIHSTKDIPAIMHDGLEISAILKRFDPRDTLISNKYQSIKDIPNDTIIGTSSMRRTAQISSKNPRIKIIPLRGNIDTRMSKASSGEIDAIILSKSGIDNLGIQNNISNAIETTEIIPAAGQGSIAIQCRKNCAMKIKELCKKINHDITYKCIMSEREFVRGLEGSCDSPIAAFVEENNGELSGKFMIASKDGGIIYRTQRSGSMEDYIKIGASAAEELRQYKDIYQ